MSNIVELKKTISDVAVQKEFESYLTPDMQLKFNKEVGFAMQAFSNNSYLASCTVDSAKKAIINVALSGLSLNPVLQQAHLVPRKNYTTKQVECCLDPDYKGLITMMEVLGVAKKPNAHVIYENDDFKYNYAFDEIIDYTPYYAKGIDAKDRGKEYGVLATCILSDGTKQALFTPIERVWEIRNTSQAYKSNKDTSLWTGVHLGEMIKKTGIRLLWKILPKNTANAEKLGQVMQLFDEADPKDEMVNVGGKEVLINSKQSENVSNVATKGVETIKENNNFEDAEVVEEFDTSFIDNLNLTEGKERAKKEYMLLYNELAKQGITGPKPIEDAMVNLGIAHKDATEFYKHATIKEIKDVVLYIKS